MARPKDLSPGRAEPPIYLILRLKVARNKPGKTKDDYQGQPFFGITKTSSDHSNTLDKSASTLETWAD